MYFAFIILDLPEDKYPSSPGDYSDVGEWASIASTPTADTSKGSDYLCLDF